MKSKFLLTISIAVAFLANARAEVKIPDEYKTGEFFIGLQAYSFNGYKKPDGKGFKGFSVFEAIEKTAQAGAKVIEFYPGQSLSPEQADVKWDHNASEEIIKKVEAKLAQHKVKAVNYGVVGIPKDEEQARKIFSFAKRLGLRAVTTESADSIDTIEKLVKEFDIMVAFHDHPRQQNNPKYRMWDPYYILELCKDRDPRIGACADTGHWQTSGINPVWAIRTLKGRVISSHMKDKVDYGQSHDVPYGNGVGEIGRCLDELKKQGFTGNISVEYEYHWENNLPEIKQCVDFVRDYKTKAK
jgi:sugar phosphate isomerase/epimerase